MLPYPSISLIGAASGWGAQIHETEAGPHILQQLGIADHLLGLGIPVGWTAMVSPMKTAEELKLSVGDSKILLLIAEHAEHLASVVKKQIQRKAFPVVLGGDHAVAIGTWSGIVNSMGAHGKFGLIWVDAHMDAHIPETSPSHAYHGMPLAVLLGKGDPSLLGIGGAFPKLSAHHVCLIDSRSYEPEEHALLKKVGVRIFYREEVEKRGIAAVFKEAIEIATTNTAGFGISIDLDAFNPCETPGVGSPEEFGIHLDDFLPALSKVGTHPNLCGLEIVEYNPSLDDAAQHTARAVFKLLEAGLINPKRILEN
jgi:arginase